ncbi:MAG: hypothetical protein ABS42_00430 [Bdellovibrio sp. SCN 50-8]|nr:MAG: hypothetical protein ABS42_00430 [Bdellovibrio sp. SCN 50-8]
MTVLSFSVASASANPKNIPSQDITKLCVEATKQLTHCEKLHGGLTVAVEDFKNTSSEKIDNEAFVKTLNESLLAINPPAKTAEALKNLPGGEGTRLWAEFGTTTASQGKGRRQRQMGVYTLSIYAKDGDRQICKVTSELVKGGRRK